MSITDEKYRLILRDLRRVFERHGVILEGEGDCIGGPVLTLRSATPSEIEATIKRIHKN
jgi:hypothetical protein